jgi:hypothetical protein
MASKIKFDLNVFHKINQDLEQRDFSDKHPCGQEVSNDHWSSKTKENRFQGREGQCACGWRAGVYGKNSNGFAI